MPFDVEPATTIVPPGAIATAFALWNRRPNPVSAVPAVRRSPGRAFRSVGSAGPRTDRIAAACAFADHDDPAVVLDRQVERVVVRPEIGDHLAPVAERGVEPAARREPGEGDVGVPASV